MRKRIETAFSQLTAASPRHIHATGFRGFLLKVSAFVIAFASDKAFIRQLGLDSLSLRRIKTACTRRPFTELLMIVERGRV